MTSVVEFHKFMNKLAGEYVDKGELNIKQRI